jgi:hypothetical protein
MVFGEVGGGKGGGITEREMCFDFLYNFCLKHLSLKRNSARYYHLRLKQQLFLPDLKKKKLKVLDRFSKNPSSGSRDVPCARTDRHDEANSSYSAILKTHLRTCRPAPFHSLRRVHAAPCNETYYSNVYLYGGRPSIFYQSCYKDKVRTGCSITSTTANSLKTW